MNCEKKQRAYITYKKASCGEYAKELMYSLFEYGYGTFYDRKSPRSGEFDKNLFLAINNSEWVIVMLDKHIFENYPEEGNWIHIEVSHALKEKKKFICLKTPGLDAEAEIPSQLKGQLFGDVSEVIEMDAKALHKTALKIRDVIEADGNVGKFEKTVNRIFSEIYLWRIALFPILGAIMMWGLVSRFQAASYSNAEIGYVFKHFGNITTYGFNLFYAILGSLLCGIFMYITRRVIRMEIIPLFLSDVAGIVFLSMMARKLTDVIFSLGNARYWTSVMGETVWNVSEVTSVRMVFITIAIQVLLYFFKRSRNYV